MTINKAISVLETGYPNLYHDFTDGQPSSKTEIKEYIREATLNSIEDIKSNNLTHSFSSIATGNLKVVSHVYLNEDGLFNVSVDVSHSYHTFEVDDVDLDIIFPSPSRSFIRKSK